jgi:hypothetical protein
MEHHLNFLLGKAALRLKIRQTLKLAGLFELFGELLNATTIAHGKPPLRDGLYRLHDGSRSRKGFTSFATGDRQFEFSPSSEESAPRGGKCCQTQPASAGPAHAG